MKGEHYLLFTVAIPFFGAWLLPVLGRYSRPTRNACAVGLVAASFFANLALLPMVAGEAVTLFLPGSLGVNLSFRADLLAVFMAIISSGLSTVIIIYSLSYISHYQHQDEYFTMVVWFLGGMMGLVYADNLVLLYGFWEVTAIASWRLIGFYREGFQVWRADKAFLMTGFGALAMLVGFLMISSQYGTFELSEIRLAGAHELKDAAVVLILLGILSKSAVLPFHSWLPDAGVAPSPVTALLHAAVLVKIGVYVFARLFVVVFPLAAHWHTLVMVVAAASALVSACAALIETDIKRIIAYSTVSQIAFIFLGLASGSELGVAGGLLYILMHGIAKGGLFLCAGIIEHNTHTKDIREMGGLWKTMPVTAVSFLLCAFSVMGIPPFGGFFSKYMVIGGAVQGGHLWLSLTFLVGAFLTVLYLLRAFQAVFLGEPTAGHQEAEGARGMVLSVASLGGLAMLSGVFINLSWPLVMEIVRQTQGVPK